MCNFFYIHACTWIFIVIPMVTLRVHSHVSTFHVQCVMWLLNLREFFSTSKQRKTVWVLIIYSNFRRIYIIDVRLIEKCKWMRQCLILFEEVVVSKVILNKLENDCIFVRGSRLGGGPNPCPPPWKIQIYLIHNLLDPHRLLSLYKILINIQLAFNIISVFRIIIIYLYISPTNGS